MAPALNPVRLSIILPCFNQRAEVEKTLKSILSQPDPIGIEIIVADGGSTDGFLEAIEDRFYNDKYSGKLQLVPLPYTGDFGRNCNLGASKARGGYLTFVEPGDLWNPIRLTQLNSQTKKTDLLIMCKLRSGEQAIGNTHADWVEKLLVNNFVFSSGSVIHRSLFDQVGGFPEGYGGTSLPKRIPGDSRYEFWLSAVVTLIRNGNIQRLQVLPFQDITPAPEDPTQTAFGRLGQLGIPPMTPELATKIHALKELHTALKLIAKSDRKHFRALFQRVKTTAKTLVRRGGSRSPKK